MPFKETSVVEERCALFRDYDTGAFTVTELCRLYGISRDCFYKTRARRDGGDPRWFDDRSHAVRQCPHATDSRIAERIIALRRRWPQRGPKKIKAMLEAECCGTGEAIGIPAASTIGDILKRAGLVEPRRRQRRPIDLGEVASPARLPNDEWSIDFKGWFRLGNGSRCDPLTITDSATRYLLEARIMEPRTDEVMEAMRRLFEIVGLPAAIRSDNGAPFGSTGAGGLTRLSVWWLKLDIEPRYIPPASPQDNGRHERMHRTLREDTAATPAATTADQQLRFDAFRFDYNELRPHEALEQTPPGAHWQPSARPLPARLDDPWYDATHEVRRVRGDGAILWRGGFTYIGEALAGELVGIAEQQNGNHLVRFCRRDLGVIDRCHGRFLRFAPPRARLRAAAEPAVTAEQ